jgi:hypothetical protein
MTTFADTSVRGGHAALGASRRARFGALAGPGFALAPFLAVAGLRRWVAWVGAAAVVFVVGSAAALSAVVALPALFVWTLAVSAAMWRGERA